MKVAAPRKIPGILAQTIGQSFSFLSNSYAVQIVQLIKATSGCIGFPLVPDRLDIIWGIYETYIRTDMALATVPIFSTFSELILRN